MGNQKVTALDTAVATFPSLALSLLHRGIFAGDVIPVQEPKPLVSKLSRAWV